MLAKPNQTMLQVALDKELHRAFKIRCIEVGRTMNQQLEALIRAWLARKG